MDIEKKIQEFEKELNSLRDRVYKLESKDNISLDIKTSTATQKQISPRELLNKYKIENDVERVLLFGYYMEHIRGVSSFSADDIKDLFYTSKVKLPLNINDKMNLNIKKGHIMIVQEKKDNKKAWVLTIEGEKLVEELSK